MPEALADVRIAPPSPDGDLSSVKEQRAELPLYASRIKVYPKAVEGVFRRLKWAALIALLCVYYLVPWLRWDRGPGAPDQAVLIDLDGPRGYFLWIEIWPQEVYFVTGFLILGAIGLFLATSLFGRLWCGYACPQTVWTDLFLWVERRIEGDRAERMRRDKAPWTPDKLWRKAATHTAWLAIAAATGGAWVAYFTDAPTLVADLLNFSASTTTVAFIGLFTATTYLLAGWAREQVCTYMCPWPRFQAAMLDEQSTIVTYQAWRGEPRGRHKQGAAWDGRGDCIDCRQCVAVCPTGIDIRDGQQLECIGCGLCIDACDAIMARVDRPPRLITWDTLARQEARACGRAPLGRRWLRPRTIIYGALLLVVAGVMLAVLATRASIELTVSRDRNPLFVILADGSVRNAYSVKVLNKARQDRDVTLTIADLPGAGLSIAGDLTAAAASVTLRAKPDAVSTTRVLVTMPPGTATTGSRPITLTLSEAGRPGPAQKTVFIAP
jgi:cytochrome c oxidase accessory protein FixG